MAIYVVFFSQTKAINLFSIVVKNCFDYLVKFLLIHV